MFKVVGSGFIIACCVYFGMNKIKECKKRIDSLGQFRSMISQLRVEIELNNTPLPKAMENIGHRFDNRCFQNCSRQILKIGGQAAFEKSLLECANEYCLNENDILSINVLSSGLGKCDLVNQLKQIDYCISRIDLALEEAKTEFSKKNSVYVSSSVMFGVLVVLVLL